MSTLSSSSSIVEVQAAYMDNASYEANQSLSQARDFAVACRILLMMRPQLAMQDGKNQMQFSVPAIQKELESAQQWITANAALEGEAGGVGVVQHTFTDFRS